MWPKFNHQRRPARKFRVISAGWWKKTILQAQRITLNGQPEYHTGASLYKTFEPARARALLDKPEFVYTPKHGSWLNTRSEMIPVPARQCLAPR